MSATPTTPPHIAPLPAHARRRLFDILEPEEILPRPNLYCDEVIDWDDLERQPIRGGTEFNANKVPSDPITRDIINTFFTSPAEPLDWANAMWLNGVLMAMAESDLRRRGLK